MLARVTIALSTLVVSVFAVSGHAAPAPVPVAGVGSAVRLGPPPLVVFSAPGTQSGGLSSGPDGFHVEGPLGSLCVGEPVFPGADLESLASARPAGYTFCIAPGVYRLTGDIDPKSGQRFIGLPGATLSGAIVLEGFTSDGGRWVIGGQTVESSPHGSCRSAEPGCRYNEVVFFDGRALRHERDLSDLGPGEFHFDYAADRIYVGDDPRTAQVELAVVPRAFDSADGIADVEIRGLVIEMFANRAQRGAIDADDGTDWIIQGNEVRKNHGGGIGAGPGNLVRGNRVHHNGQLGIHASGGAGIVVEDNEIHHNNTMGFSYGWEAGGTKFVKTTGLVVRGNHVHDNVGPGLWTDIDNIDTLYEDNLVEDNADAGIFHEISYSATIRNNTIRGNGFDRGDWLWGAGIQIAASPDVVVTGNVLRDNANGIAVIQQVRGSGAHGPHEVDSILVHDNDVRMASGGSGMVQDVGDSSIFDRDIRFQDNTYRVPEGAKVWAWANGWRSASAWRSYGHDVNGSVFRF